MAGGDGASATAESQTPGSSTPTEPAVAASATPTAADLRERAAQKAANKVFSKGLVAYLYDPRPKRVSKSNIGGAEFSVRYILPENAKPRPAMLVVWKSIAME